MKVIIAGGRDFQDYALLERKCDKLLVGKENVTIISGRARGADLLGERYAAERQLRILTFPADWDLHGKRAGYIRNQQMAGEATHLIAFWDGESKGTKMMIDIARDHRLKIKVFRY